MCIQTKYTYLSCRGQILFCLVSNKYRNNEVTNKLPVIKIQVYSSILDICPDIFQNTRMKIGIYSECHYISEACKLWPDFINQYQKLEICTIFPNFEAKIHFLTVFNFPRRNLRHSNFNYFSSLDDSIKGPTRFL